jgi:two-component system, LytTR family, sensor kinase
MTVHDGAPHASAERAPDIPFRMILLVWSIPAAIAVVQSAIAYALIGELARERVAVLLQFPRWLAWAFVTPAIIALVRRVPLRRPLRASAVVRHVLAALVCTVVVEVAWTQLAMLVEPPRNVPAGAANLIALRTFVSPLARLAIGAICYVGVATTVTALDAVSRSQREAVRTAELERDLAHARVHAIKMQVHPHFLFNTLHAVSVLITEDPATARTMVVRLGDLLRTTLARASRAEVELRQELELVQRYLGIEQVRFGDRLTVEYAVDEDVMGAYVPDLILQPLTENAIKYGVARRPGAHRITIRGERLGDALVLSVADEGVGLDAAGVQPPDGVGLHTVRRRLEHLYGRDQSLTLTGRGDAGAVARVSLPFHMLPLVPEAPGGLTMPVERAHA